MSNKQQTRGGTEMKKRTQKEIGREFERELEENGWGSPRLAELEREFWKAGER